ncbi:Ohr subfamily peroxiredoxin [Crossiella equi]|uniref:Ohr subfamily peroxiredoxin n=1 Tax=Crossiella equi TaxID=130796 RepID=A0ABS5AMB3_9PSEU|nr:Ohr family peroxiredoxin [Crossiella equi]MBP2477546.1 Ohr subfamily peroxiredoxin [Crossiella equi]
MTATLPATQYTAAVTVTGEGRNGGRAVASDGNLDVRFAFPKELGGSGDATNPEQLLAAGWGACFTGAIRRAAAAAKVRVGGIEVDAEVTLHHDGAGEFSLSAVLHVRVSGVDAATAERLGEAAHQLCPYSKALGPSIPVVIDATTV